MIEELNGFFKALVDRYGQGDFVIELTITDEACKLLHGIGPKVGESVDIFCAMGRVRIKNGGEKYQSLGNILVRPMAVPEHELEKPKLLPASMLPIAIPEIKDTIAKYLKKGSSAYVEERLQDPKDTIEIPCDAVAGTGPKYPPPPEDISVPEKLETRVKEVLRSDANLRRLTVAGYPYVITGIEGSSRIGEVELPNGEIVKAVWDKSGNEIGGGRPKFQLPA